jgi:hypothetical protein
MGLINRVKNWLLPQKARHHSLAEPVLGNGTAVAGFVQRVSADVEIIHSSNMARPLAVLMPPALAAATPLRTIPLFLVPPTCELADVEIIHHARPAPKLQLVHNVDRAIQAIAPPSPFMLAARLASTAHLNTVVGKKPYKQPQLSRATPQAKSTNRPRSQNSKPSKASKVQPGPECFVRPLAQGKAVVVRVPGPAKRRTK